MFPALRNVLSWMARPVIRIFVILAAFPFLLLALYVGAELYGNRDADLVRIQSRLIRVGRGVVEAYRDQIGCLPVPEADRLPRALIGFDDLVSRLSPPTYHASGQILPPDPFDAEGEGQTYKLKVDLNCISHRDRLFRISVEGKPFRYYTSGSLYLLAGNGPDRRADLASPDFSSLATLDRYIATVSYDPSNGTLSSGDLIVRGVTWPVQAAPTSHTME